MEMSYHFLPDIEADEPDLGDYIQDFWRLPNLEVLPEFCEAFLMCVTVLNL
jgi:hypothetical protein